MRWDCGSRPLCRLYRRTGTISPCICVCVCLHTSNDDTTNILHTHNQGKESKKKNGEIYGKRLHDHDDHQSHHCFESWWMTIAKNNKKIRALVFENGRDREFETNGGKRPSTWWRTHTSGKRKTATSSNFVFFFFFSSNEDSTPPSRHIKWNAKKKKKILCNMILAML